MSSKVPEEPQWRRPLGVIGGVGDEGDQGQRGGSALGAPGLRHSPQPP